MGTDPKPWAEAFVSEMSVDGERIPFERVLAHHLDAISKLRSASGMTWRSVASLLARAGARRADGSPISADQLRVGHARLVRHAAKAVNGPPLRSPPLVDNQRVVRTEPSSVAELPKSRPPRGANSTATETASPDLRSPSSDRENVSDDEIALALSRLTRLPFRP